MATDPPENLTEAASPVLDPASDSKIRKRRHRPLSTAPFDWRRRHGRSVARRTEQPVRRRVALKLIKAGMDSREVVARFESERQALALMDHPAIAKVFDAGSTRRAGRTSSWSTSPGCPSRIIATSTSPHHAATHGTLHQVCEGVQHAHQKAIIHRDLKPSNILVSEVDGRPAPQIIDFGVAKAPRSRWTQTPCSPSWERHRYA